MKTIGKVLRGLFLNLFKFLTKLFRKKDKSGVCYNCGKKVANIGGHIDYCIDRGNWKIKQT